MKPKTTRPVCVDFLLSTFHLMAQEAAAQRDEMAANQLKRIAAEVSARCLSDNRTLDDWKEQRSGLRRLLLEMLGLDPLPARTPLKVRITGQLERDAYRLEKIAFQSPPGPTYSG